MRLLPIALAAAALGAAGCPSAYQRTYDREMQALEAEERAREAQQEAERAEARSYVAVVLFDVNSSAIGPDGIRELEWFLEKIRPHPHVVIDVKGFADSTGGEETNQRLSDERAENVRKHLIMRGVPPDRVTAMGFSSQSPARANETAAGRRQNRRAEVRVR